MQAAWKDVKRGGAIIVVSNIAKENFNPLHFRFTGAMIEFQ